MPSVNSRSMPNVWPSSTLTTPSLPTFSIASAMTSPISSSPAEMVATRAIWSLPEISLDCAAMCATTALTAVSMPRLRPSGSALADDRLGEHGRGRGAVAGDIVGRRGDLADQLRALVLEDVLDLDLPSDGHTVVGDRRLAPLLVEDDIAAARAERHLDRVGDRVDTEFERFARILGVLEFLVSHLSSDLLRSTDDPGEHVRLAQNQ